MPPMPFPDPAKPESAEGSHGAGPGRNPEVWDVFLPACTLCDYSEARPYRLQCKSPQ